MMTQKSNPNIPPGWSHNPSAWSRRLPMVGLALIGCGIASYLALYQMRRIDHAWEPLFGDGSRRILRESWVARLLPIPDAALGAMGYLADAILALIGSELRWRNLPSAVFGFAALVSLMAIASLFLLLAQPILFHASCTLCIVSACTSLLMVWPATSEAMASIQHVKSTSHP